MITAALKLILEISARYLKRSLNLRKKITAGPQNFTKSIYLSQKAFKTCLHFKKMDFAEHFWMAASQRTSNKTLRGTHTYSKKLILKFLKKRC